VESKSYKDYIKIYNCPTTTLKRKYRIRYYLKCRSYQFRNEDFPLPNDFRRAKKEQQKLLKKQQREAFYSYEYFVSKANNINISKQARHQHRMKAMKRFPDKYNIKDFPLVTFVAMPKTYEELVKRYETDHESRIKLKAKRDFPYLYNLEHFPRKKNKHKYTYEMFVSEFNNPSTGALRRGILKKRAACIYPSLYKESDFPSRRKKHA